GDRINEDLETAKRPGCIQYLERPRMELPEGAEHDFRTELDRARAARMVPIRPTSLDLQFVYGRAAGFEHRKCVSLGVEDAYRFAIPGPVAPLAFHLPPTAAYA